MLKTLLSNLYSQIKNDAEVEILTFPDDGEITTGNKRNKLIEQATGKYVVFQDDDDEIMPNYIDLVLEAAKSDPDVICFKGFMTINGINRKDFYFDIDNPYTAAEFEGQQVYLRYPNHLCPIRTTIAKSVRFPNKTLGEDYEWATEIHEKKLLKTQYKIDEFIYHYCYNSNK